MKKFVLSAALLFSALAGNAEGISSPSGMVKLDFELTKRRETSLSGGL
mgnify:CR=1 FL=1